MTYQLPDGYTVRPATQEDADIVCNLRNTRSLWILNSNLYDETTIRKEWDHPRFNLETDSLLVFDAQSALIGYAHIRDVKTPPVDVFSTYSVHPNHDSQNAVWEALLEWTDAEARRVIPRAPSDVLICLVSGGSAEDSTKLGRFEASGFGHSRTFHRMTIEFQTPIMPLPPVEGVILRPFQQGDDDEALVHTYRDAFRDHYGHLEEPFESDLAKWRRWMEDDDFDPNLWLMATDSTEGSEIVGYSCCYPPDSGDDGLGLIDEVGVRRSWRRRGIGRFLLTESLRALQDHGCKGASLRVDSDNKNQALTLYESVGMRVVSSSHTYVKELRPGVNLVTQ